MLWKLWKVLTFGSKAHGWEESEHLSRGRVRHSYLIVYRGRRYKVFLEQMEDELVGD